MPNPDVVEYGSDFKYGPLVGAFGHGIYFDVDQALRPRPADIVAYALRLGWSHGCPVAKALIGIDSDGYERMARRYSDCNQVFYNLFTASLRRNPQLAYNLMNYSKRPGDEPVGRHDPLSVPESHKTLISPMGGIPGFAIPRLLLYRISRYPTTNNRGQDIIQSVTLQDIHIMSSQTPDQLLAAVAGALSTDPHLEREYLLFYTLPQCILDESNCHSAFTRLAQVLIEKAPDLCKCYGELTRNQRKALEIADVPLLSPKSL